MIDLEKIGKYKVTAKLGQGSFGVVYKGRDAYLKRDVAIKICSVEDESLRQRFFREAEISGKLVHKNIVTVYEFGFEGEIPYLVQELLSGQDLNRLVKRRAPIAPALKLEYLLQVAAGLGYAHSQGVIHRDIKPSNIRVLENGRLKIMDFGIAKLASAETQLTQKGVTMGTASYLPPEQVRGAELDHRADVFSFGVLAYELLTYERPFRGNTLSALIYQILYKVPQVMSDAWADAPEPLSRLIAKCLDKKPERRFGSFAELIPELSAIREDVLAGKWPALSAGLATASAPDVATVATAPAPASEPTDVLSQSAIAETARGVLEGKVGDYTISTTITAPEPDPRSSRSTRPITALPEEPVPPDELKTRILPTLPEVEPGEADGPRQELAQEIGTLVAQGHLEAAKEQLEATLHESGLAAPDPVDGESETRVLAPDAVDSASDTYRTVFRPPLDRLKWLGAGAAAVLVAGLGWLLLRGGEEPVATAPPPAPVPAAAPALAAAGGLAIAAVPWAEVTEITDDRGYVQELPAAAFTPLYLELAAGSYRVHLQLPGSEALVSCDVEVTPEAVARCAPPAAETSTTGTSATEYFRETGWWD